MAVKLSYFGSIDPLIGNLIADCKVENTIGWTGSLEYPFPLKEKSVNTDS